MFGLIHKYKTPLPTSDRRYAALHNAKWRWLARVVAFLTMILVLTPFHVVVGAWNSLKENWARDMRIGLEITFGKWVECDWAWRPVKKEDAS